MHAVTLKEFGPADNLIHETVPDPTPAEGQLRIAVRTAGVHQIETAVRAGLPIGPPLPELPTVFGSEVAGVVDAVGPGVDDAWVGRAVTTAAADPGGYAELTLAPVEQVHPVPEGVDHQTAVAMVRTGATTLGMLQYADLTADDVVLITSAAGGIGQLLVSHARSIGATVIGVAGGPEKVERVRELGADLAVDYRQPDWGERIRRWLAGEVDDIPARKLSLVLDGVGGDVADTAFDLLGHGGRMVVIGASSRKDFTPEPGAAEARGITVTNALQNLLSSFDEFHTLAERALEEAAAGRFVPGLHAFPLARAADAHRAIEDRQTSGKVILEP